MGFFFKEFYESLGLLSFVPLSPTAHTTHCHQEVARLSFLSSMKGAMHAPSSHLKVLNI